MKQKNKILLTFITAGICLGTHAASYYSDPVGGSMGNNGTSTNTPWGNLKAIFGAGKTFSAGDEIFLMNGAHEDSYLTGTHTDYVTIKAYPGHTPKIAAILMGPGAYWAFDGLTFTTDGTGGAFTHYYMLSTATNCTHLKVENCSFYSATNSASWSKADWYANAEDAVMIRGDHIIFNTNTIENTYFALEIRGNHAEVKGNLIDNFGGDALRALGSEALYEGNVIRDAYVHDYETGNHDDAIQMYPYPNGSFDPFGTISNVVIRNNKIYSFADPITPAMTNDNLVGYWMQSIINTDGHIENVVVENNLVVADHPHGITLLGPIDCRVQNNTVIKIPTSVNPVANHIPWIAFWVDKQGNQPTNNIMRNNIASEFTPESHSGGSNILVENNLEPASNTYTNIFSDYNNFDLNLKTGSPAINAGVNTDLTTTDIDGKLRLVGTYVDCGAYEFQPFEAWIAGYPGVGAATNMTDDPDNDKLNNLAEWALGGNPDDENDTGYAPTIEIVRYHSKDWLEFGYAKRNDADDLGLTYYVEQNVNLVDGVWTNANYEFEEDAPDSAGPGFAVVLNRVNIAVEDTQFMRLIIETN